MLSYCRLAIWVLQCRSRRLLQRFRQGVRRCHSGCHRRTRDFCWRDLFEKYIDAAIASSSHRWAGKASKKSGILAWRPRATEHRYYLETLGWMQFLAVRDLLICSTRLCCGVPQIKPYANRGATLSPKPSMAPMVCAIWGERQCPSRSRRSAGWNAADGIEHDFGDARRDRRRAARADGRAVSNPACRLRPYVDYVALGHPQAV